MTPPLGWGQHYLSYATNWGHGAGDHHRLYTGARNGCTAGERARARGIRDPESRVAQGKQPKGSSGRVGQKVWNDYFRTCVLPDCHSQPHSVTRSWMVHEKRKASHPLAGGGGGVLVLYLQRKIFRPQTRGATFIGHKMWFATPSPCQSTAKNTAPLGQNKQTTKRLPHVIGHGTF